MTTLVIAGSRTLGRYHPAAGLQVVERAIEQAGLTDIGKIISGGAHGPDQWGQAWAQKHGVSCTIYRPEYDRYPSKVAPLKRNKKMARLATAAIILFDGESLSRGSLHMWEAAREMGVSAWAYSVREGTIESIEVLAGWERRLRSGRGGGGVE